MNWGKWICFLVLVFSLTERATAEVMITRILKVDHAEKEEPETLIYLANGRVARIERDSDLLHALEDSSRNQEEIGLTLNSERKILAAESVPSSEEKEISSHESIESEKSYRASVIAGPSEALKIYKGLNRRYRSESQCYNRAHIWSWEMQTRHQIRSMKVFLFFTRKYIRRFNFEWWFHVAPFVYVREDGKIKEKVMDYRYTYSPVSMREWTNIFMHNNAECSEVTRYTDYEYTREDPAKGWCMLLKVPMYYYQPIDLEALDKKSKQKLFWEEWDLGNAYREAFGISSK